MNLYEKMTIESEENYIVVVEKQFKSKAKGLCKNNKIRIRRDLGTVAEKVCIITEELGHYHTTVGNILDQSKIENRKQEEIARRWAYERLVKIQDLVRASREGIRNRFELAEYLGVTEEFLDGVLVYYKAKYGTYYQMDNCLICFEPLGVIEKFF
ncbi:ImmA/IrrE family metallo-endopeptidase [Alkaliphilus crotonatoxidans]